MCLSLCKTLAQSLIQDTYSTVSQSIYSMNEERTPSRFQTDTLCSRGKQWEEIESKTPKWKSRSDLKKNGAADTERSDLYTVTVRMKLSDERDALSETKQWGSVVFQRMKSFPPDKIFLLLLSIMGNRWQSNVSPHAGKMNMHLWTHTHTQQAETAWFKTLQVRRSSSCFRAARPPNLVKQFL